MAQTEFNLNAQLLSLIAHKLRTPLSIITGYCEAIQTQTKNSLSPFADKALQEINTQGTHLSQLVDKLLAFNQVFDTQEKALEKKEISLKSLLKECASQSLAQEEIRPQVSMPDTQESERRGTFIETDCPADLTLHANEGMFRLCIQELLSNAIKFNNRAEKIIKIQCVNHGNSISLSVRDYGTGIRPQDVQRIFEPFYQVDDDFTGQITGWGLGLTTVKRIVELHHGTISVVSDRGLGSIFTINLPIL
ncbi:MAG: HAMP domain-containing histidine kinase [Elusimicrobiaceae bacterium]|nr:HAMP domain-containing histidine kinase [Elusimicrobiaceae bacterium]